jgi:MYXO-CTERM domain-containing protein
MVGLTASIGAAGCFLVGNEETDDADGNQTAAGNEASQALKATVILTEGGCLATKVGPKHLLVAARCVFNKPAYAKGKTIGFRPATEPGAVNAENSVRDAGAAPDAAAAGRDAGAAATDAGLPQDASAPARDAGAASDAGTRKKNEAKIVSVNVAESFATNCAKENTCALSGVLDPNYKDVAVLIVEDGDLEGVTALPIDLDPVGVGDPIMTIGSNCDRLDGQRGQQLKTAKTIAVPHTSVNHDTSPYKDKPALTSRIRDGYVVTPGGAWAGQTDPKLCDDDLGAPLFRAGQAAVVGVFSNYTVFEKNKQLPATMHYTRVDNASGIGGFLGKLDVQTVKSCSESAEKCPENKFEGGPPKPPTTSTSTTTPSDAGTDARPPANGGTGSRDSGTTSTGGDKGGEMTELPERGENSELGATEEDTRPEANEGDGGVRKKKKKDDGGCSATPGNASGGTPFFAAIAALSFLAARRRRRP